MAGNKSFLIASLLVVSSVAVLLFLRGSNNRRKARRMLFLEMARNYSRLSRLRTRLMNPLENDPICDTPRDLLEFEAFEDARRTGGALSDREEMASIAEIYKMLHSTAEMSGETQVPLFKLNRVINAFDEKMSSNLRSAESVGTRS